MLRSFALVTLCLLSAALRSIAQTEHDPESLKQVIIERNLSRFEGLPEITFSTETKTTYAERFLQRNPKFSEYNGISTKYTTQLLNNKYLSGTSMTYQDGRSLPEFVIAYNGETYNYLSPIGVPTLIISKNSVPDAPDAVPLGTVIFLPFSFLFPTAQTPFFPLVTPKQVADKDLWKTAFEKAELLPNADPDFVVLKFPQLNGESYVVSFSTKSGFYPTKFEKYDKDGKLFQRYAVDSLDTFDLAGRAFPYPGKVSLETFLVGFPRSTVSIATNSIQVLKDPNDVQFEIDPGSVDHIWDNDNKIQIEVPR